MKKETVLKIEKKFLQAMITHPYSLLDIGQKVNSDDFSLETHRFLYKVLLELQRSNQELTFLNFIKYCIENNLTIHNELIEYFTENTTYEHPLTLVDLLKTTSTKRFFEEVFTKAVSKLEKGEDTLSTLMSTREKIDNLSKNLLLEENETLEKDLENFVNYIGSSNGDYRIIPTPYKALDDVLGGGFKEGQLITVAARTGIGKSVVATQSIAKACANKKSVLMFSLEMAKTEVYQRLFACYGDIMISNLSITSQNNNYINNKINKVKNEIKDWKLEIIDSADITMEKILAISEQKAQSKQGVDFIVIDYLQLISTKGSNAHTREAMVAELSRASKMLAKKLKCPVMILVQLKREEKTDDPNRMPTKADIRESGAIAADSDVILVLHRKYGDEAEIPKVTMLVDKNRGGPEGRYITLECHLGKAQFVHKEHESKQDDNEDIYEGLLDDEEVFTL